MLGAAKAARVSAVSVAACMPAMHTSVVPTGCSSTAPLTLDGCAQTTLVSAFCPTCDAREELQLTDSATVRLGDVTELKIEVAQLSKRSACAIRAWLYQSRKKRPYGVSQEPSQLQKNPVS